jgi:tetratricopeptide (TPR) repeat protein
MTADERVQQTPALLHDTLKMSENQNRKSRISRVPTWVWAAGLVVACLVPFANKAFHIDDPLFLWTAQQIRKAPADFYGFRVNWFGLEMPMTDATANPPLMAYYLALGSLLGGWSEIWLHLWAMLPAIAVALGTLQLARSFTERGLLPVTLTILTPGFLICATSLMCDVMMVAFWIWAIVLWQKGLVRAQYRYFVWASLLAGFCGLTKYSGFSVVPLLFIYALWRERKIGAWAWALLIPLAMFGGYELLSQRLYGVSLYQNAADYAREVRPTSVGEAPIRLIGGLVFSGGCALPVIVLAPWLWKRRGQMLGMVLLLLAVLGPSILNALQLSLPPNHFGFSAVWRDGWLSLRGNWQLDIQRGIWLMGGISVLALATADFVRYRDAVSALLGLWIIGVLLFASVLNWTLNGRSILPMLPAVGILVARRLEAEKCVAGHGFRGILFSSAIVLSSLAAMALALADYRQANSRRLAANTIASKYGPPEHNLVFQGHWGFQYYLQNKGFQALDVWKDSLNPGTSIAIPANNDIYEVPPEATRLIEVLKFRPNHWLSTLDRNSGAGFHTDFWGPLPFGIGTVEPAHDYIFEVIRPFKFSSGVALIEAADAGEEKEELERCREQLTKDSNDAVARFVMSLLLTHQGQFSDAISELLTVLKLRPNDFAANAQLGLLYQATGNTSEAKAHYYEAIAVMPDFISGLNNLAWVLATDPDPAIRDGTEAVRLARRACALTVYRRPHFLGTLGAAYAEAGRFAEAIRTADMASAIASRAGQTVIAEKNRQLLQLYRSGKAYREDEK